MKFSVGYQLPDEYDSIAAIVSDYREHISSVYFSAPGENSARTQIEKKYSPYMLEELRYIRDMGIGLTLLYNAMSSQPSPCWDLMYSKNVVDAAATFLQESWVFPKDIGKYAPYFSEVKLATRMHYNPRRVVSAYARGRFVGNMFDLTEPSYSRRFTDHIMDATKFPEDWFEMTTNCSKNCDACGYCRETAKKLLVSKKELERKRYPGLTGENLSEFTVDAHRAIMEEYLAHGKPSREYELALIASIPQIRMTRRIAGVTELDEPETDAFYEDSIGLIGNWRRRGPVYELPYSCLYGRKIRNLITAGRCISTTDTMWDQTRVIPACAVTGEAAGLAAAMTRSFAELSVTKLQAELRSRGVRLHRNEL